MKNQLTFFEENKLPFCGELALTYKTKHDSFNRPKITGSGSAYDIFRNNWDQGLICLQEQFKIMFLNNSNKVIGMACISTGGITGCLVDIRLVLGSALKMNATAIILAHNHPSGSLRPSEADKKLTKKLKDGAKLLDIAIHDHLIITDQSYLSFADEGLI